MSTSSASHTPIPAFAQLGARQEDAAREDAAREDAAREDARWQNVCRSTDTQPFCGRRRRPVARVCGRGWPWLWG